MTSTALPQVGDDIIVSMIPPARKYTCRLVVDSITPFGSVILVSGRELNLDGSRTLRNRRKNHLRLDLATWKAA
jgi:hypothetical protein